MGRFFVSNFEGLGQTQTQLCILEVEKLNGCIRPILQIRSHNCTVCATALCAVQYKSVVNYNNSMIFCLVALYVL